MKYTKLLLFFALVVAGFGQAIEMGSAVSGSTIAAAPAGSTPVGGPASSTDYALAAWNGTAGNLLRNTSVLTNVGGDLTAPGSLILGAGGGGLIKDSSSSTRLSWNSVANTYTANVTTGASTGHTFTGATFTGAAGINQAGLQITNTINQTSTAGFTDFLINRNETAAGSGTQYLFQAQVGSSDRFTITNAAATQVKIGASGSGGQIRDGGNSNRFSWTTSNNTYDHVMGAAALFGHVIQGTTFTGGAGINQGGVTINNTLNQTSTAAFTALRIATTETAAGSGSQILINAFTGAAGTTEVFRMLNSGTIRAVNGGGGAPAYSFLNDSATGIRLASTNNIAVDASGSTTFSGAVVAATGLHTATVTGTGGASYGGIAPITLYVKSVTVLTAGVPADIATITIPAGITRWTLGPSANTAMGSTVIAETAAGTLAAATFTVFDTAAGGGLAMSAGFLGPVATTGTGSRVPINGTAATTGQAWSTTTTLYIRQTVASANAGTCSFYITIYPMP